MKSYAYLLLLAVLSILGSCSKGDGEDPNTPAALEAHIAGVSLITRGGAADATEISSLGIYAVNATVGEKTYGEAPAGTQRTYKLENGIASPDGDAQTLWLNLEKATILVFPETGATAKNTVQVTFTIDNADYPVNLPNESIRWEAGKNYLYTAKLSGKELNIRSVKVAAWGNETGGNITVN